MKKITLAAILLAGTITAPRAEAYDLYRCQHYVRAYVSYAKAARFDKAKAELRKAQQEGCPSNVSLY
jgi:hypothetical protein